MKDNITMTLPAETMKPQRPLISKIADFILSILACAGLGYCVGKQIAGGSFAVSDGLIIFASIGILAAMIKRRANEFPKANRPYQFRRYLTQLGVGALIGGAGMGAFILLFDTILSGFIDKKLYWNLAAVFLSVLYIILGVTVALIASDKKMMNVKPGQEPISDEEFSDTRPIFFWASIGLIVYGAILAILALSSGIFGSTSIAGMQNWVALAALLFVIAGQWLCNFILWRRYDELYRDVTRTACAISYIFLESTILIWAGLTIFGFSVRFDPMAIVVVMMTISLITTMTVSIKRGLN